MVWSRTLAAVTRRIAFCSAAVRVGGARLDMEISRHDRPAVGEEVKKKNKVQGLLGGPLADNLHRSLASRDSPTCLGSRSSRQPSGVAPSRTPMPRFAEGSLTIASWWTSFDFADDRFKFRVAAEGGKAFILVKP